MRRVILLGTVLMVALLGAAPAQAKPAVLSGTLTLQFKWEPLAPLEPSPGVVTTTEGRAFYGKLQTTPPGCRRGRQVFASYTFPPYNKSTPLVRPMWSNGEGPIKTDAHGVWQAKPVVFAGTAYRVIALVKASFGCPRIKSRPLTLPPG